jgi:hypothetical protein
MAQSVTVRARHHMIARMIARGAPVIARRAG